jgi:hypothetical protein
MVNENNIPIENKKPFEIIYELKDYEVKRSSLSRAAQKKVIKMYGGNYVSERRKEGYGPMPFVDEATALIVARADDIMVRLGERYPNVVEIFKHNPKGTVEWLKAETALIGYNVIHNFVIDFTKEGNVERSGPRAWEEYRNQIEIYVTNLCKKWKEEKGEDFESRLRPAIKALSDHIHKKHEAKFSRWPEVGGLPNVGTIELDIGGSYEADSYYIVWSCRGWMSIKDERPRRHFYKAEFGGKPDMKILQLDGVLLGDLNRRVLRLAHDKEEALRSAMAMIDAKQGTRDPSLLTWEDFK